MSLRAYFADTIKVATASFNRQANTTAYTTGHVVSDGATTHLMKFPNAARLAGYGAGRGGTIVKARIATNNKNWVSAMRLYLYNVPETGATIPADAASMVTYFADFGVTLGYIDFPAMANDDSGVASTGTTAELVPSQPFAYEVSAAALQNTPDDAIYGVLVDKTGGTPTSGQTFSVELTFHRN